MIKLVAFDMFGTVLDMTGVSREQIEDYVNHVRREDFTPYVFPREWWELKLFPDVVPGIERLQKAGYKCVTLSNGCVKLINHVSWVGGEIDWDKIIDLAQHRVYKPHVDAYRTIEKDTGFKPAECLMVTANPTFGDIEGAAAIGMQSMVIRQPEGLADIVELAKYLDC